ncbi:MAG: hypothetical protein H0W07_04770 [Chloroflexi bacterium]|nr:hypothetical protein [Chloroflexota bacterium]
MNDDERPGPIPLPVRRDRARLGAVSAAALTLMAGAAITLAASPAADPSAGTVPAAVETSPGATAQPTASSEPGASTAPGDKGGKGIRGWGRGGPGGLGGLGGPGFGFAGPGAAGIHSIHVGGITVTAIDGSSLSLATENGWTRTITVADGTSITKAGKTLTLEDITVGDTIGLHEQRSDDGTWTIESVVVIQPIVGGTVTVVEGSSITIEQRDGSKTVIHVDADTEYLVRGDDSPAISDIKLGDRVVAEGTLNDDGSLEADRVAAGSPGHGVGPGHHRGDGDEPKVQPSTEPASEPASEG